jgi:hypothetical protein
LYNFLHVRDNNVIIIMIRGLFRKSDGKGVGDWTGFIWLRVGTGDGLL